MTKFDKNESFNKTNKHAVLKTLRKTQTNDGNGHGQKYTS